MKVVFLLFLQFLTFAGLTQTKKLLQNQWILVNEENLDSTPPKTRMDYTRYSFFKGKTQISFNAPWDDYELAYTLNDNQLAIGFQIYIIETLTDSSLVFFAPGFKRMKFLSEAHLCKDSSVLELADKKNNVPVYKGGKKLSPRFGPGSIYTILDKYVKGYQVLNESNFKMEFTITEKGEVEDIIVTNSIAYGFDKGMMDGLKKTSGNWKPALFRGVPVRTRVSVDRKYLPSSGIGRTSN